MGVSSFFVNKTLSASTVGELVDILKNIPPDTPVDCDLEDVRVSFLGRSKGSLDLIEISGLDEDMRAEDEGKES